MAYSSHSAKDILHSFEVVRLILMQMYWGFSINASNNVSFFSCHSDSHVVWDALLSSPEDFISIESTCNHLTDSILNPIKVERFN